VGEIRDTAIIDALRRQMAIAAARQVVATGNLANVNTPGYKARAIDFGEALEREMGGAIALNTTASGHLGGVDAPPDTAAREVEGLPARRDGNTVQIDRELLTMTSAAGQFARAQTALAAKFRLVRYAINEGR
jgi:flagellar basal-body rod protein FlgB